MTAELQDIAIRPTDYRTEKQLVDYFVQLLEHHLAGRHIERIIHKQPVDVCRLGVISPWRKEPADEIAIPDDAEGEDIATEASGTLDSDPSTAQDESRPSDDEEKSTPEPVEEKRESVERSEDKDYTRRPPSSLGFELVVKPDDGEIEIELDVSFAVYTKHFPTYEEQKQSLGQEIQERSSDMPLAEVCQRRNIVVQGLRFSIKGTKVHNANDEGTIQAEMDKVIKIATKEPDILRVFPANIPKVKAESLVSEQQYINWLNGITGGCTKLAFPFKAILKVRTQPYGDSSQRLSVYLLNNTPSGTYTEDNYNIFGDAQIQAVIVKGKVLPIEILPIPEDYQYNREVWAVGHNTSVEVSEDKSSLKTQALARFEQPRLTTQSESSARFEDLVDDPFAVLDGIHIAMVDYAKNWQVTVDNNALKLDPSAHTACKEDLDAYNM